MGLGVQGIKSSGVWEVRIWGVSDIGSSVDENFVGLEFRG